jgi:hypothetical protein
MAETPADVKRDIELTRERISDTLVQLEQKTNVMQIVKDHPWPALAVAVGAGVLLSGSRADVKAAAATVGATQGASSKLGTVLDEVVSNLMGGISLAFQQRVDGFVNELKEAIGAPTGGQQRSGGSRASGGTSGGGATGARNLADMSSGSGDDAGAYAGGSLAGSSAAYGSGSASQGSTGSGLGSVSNATQNTGGGSSTLSQGGSQGLGSTRAD